MCIYCIILCGQRWIRTTEGVSQQIYSLPHLATLVFARVSLTSSNRNKKMQPLKK